MATQCPPITPALIAYLRSVFPDQAVNPDSTNPWEAYGSARVIRHLEAKMEQQDEEPDVST